MQTIVDKLRLYQQRGPRELDELRSTDERERGTRDEL
jgi:hypothetical protein